MAICVRCKKEMLDSSIKTCTANKIVEFPDGTKMSSVPYTSDDPELRCHDCNVATGGFHHLNCDMERCPRCSGQFLGCSCFIDGNQVDTQKVKKNVLEDMKNCLKEMNIKTVEPPSRDRFSSFTSETDCGGFVVRICVSYDPINKYATIGIDSLERFSSKKLAGVRALINLINRGMSAYHYSVCPKGRTVSSYCGMYVLKKRFPKSKFKKLLAWGLNDTRMTFPFIRRIETEGASPENLMLELSRKRGAEDEEIKDLIKQDVKAVFSKLDLCVEDDYEKHGAFMLDLCLSSDEKFNAHMAARISRDLQSIDLFLGPEYVVPKKRFATIIELISLINESSTIGHLIIHPDVRMVQLQTGVVLENGLLDKAEFEKAVQTLLGNGTLFFPLILEQISSNESPDILMERFWKENHHFKRNDCSY